MNEAPEVRTCSREERSPQATPSRKRPIDSDSDAEPQTKRTRLTRKNLALFDKMGKKKKAPDSTDDSNTTKTTSTTTSGFADQARRNRILPPLDSKPPKNAEHIRKRHAKSRATASPPESVYEGYANRVGRAGNEATVVVETSELLKRYDDKGYNRAFNRPFTNVPQNAGYNDGLSAPQPDFVEGLGIGEYGAFPIDDCVPGAALYQDDPYSLTLPHVAGEWKGPKGDMGTARLQAAYDGAAMVYARNKALAYMGKSDPPGHAEITTFTTDGTTLNMYSHYAIPSEEDKNTLEYHQYQYATTNVKDTHQGHNDGRRGLRNSQDYAKDQSYALKDQLKEHWKQQRFYPIAEEDPPPVPYDTFEETNADEDETGYEIVEQPCQPTPTASLPPEDDYDHSKDRRKRKALPPSHAPPKPRRSKAKPYWTIDDESGQYYHKHSDGTVSWYDDDGDED